MIHGPDPYARALADLDRLLAESGDRNERVLLETLADLGRVGRTGQRLADYLTHIAATDPSRREAINELLSAWRHALTH
jgi:hypothetical protein